MIENPKQFLSRLVTNKVRVFLKWGQYYEGILVEFDTYFNIVLSDCTEFDCKEEKESVSEVGMTFIRCNNIKMIQEYK